MMMKTATYASNCANTNTSGILVISIQGTDFNTSSFAPVTTTIESKNDAAMVIPIRRRTSQPLQAGSSIFGFWGIGGGEETRYSASTLGTDGEFDGADKGFDSGVADMNLHDSRTDAENLKNLSG